MKTATQGDSQRGSVLVSVITVAILISAGCGSESCPEICGETCAQTCSDFAFTSCIVADRCDDSRLGGFNECVALIYSSCFYQTNKASLPKLQTCTEDLLLITCESWLANRLPNSCN